MLKHMDFVVIFLVLRLHDSRSENPREILSECFRRSVDAAVSQRAGVEIVCEARKQLAAYADCLYRDVVAYLESRDFETHQKLMKIRQEKAAELGKLKSAASDQEVRRAALFLNQESVKDQSEYDTLIEQRQSYLLQAVENYLICLAQSSQSDGSFDVRISRFISLWFDNRASQPMTRLLDEWLPKIATYNFIAVLPQLAARLVVHARPDTHHAHFPGLLIDLMRRCAVQHPHHTLPVIMALVLTNKDKQLTNTPLAVNPQEEERILASNKLLDHLKKTPVGTLCRKVHHLSANLIQLANKPVPKTAKTATISAELADLKESLEDVAIPTLSIPVNAGANYDNIVGIVSFDANYQLVGGINQPKKMYCLGTDGRRRPFLLKGLTPLITSMSTFWLTFSNPKRVHLFVIYLQGRTISDRTR